MSRAALFAVFGLLMSSAGFAGSAAAASGLVSHRVIAQDRGHVAIVNAKGEMEWEVPCPGTSHDIAALPNGHFLLHTGPATVVEMTPDKKVVWQCQILPAAAGELAPSLLQVRFHGDLS